MLTITIPAKEGFNNNTSEFLTIKKEQKLQLEHSLLSLSKWESKWHKPFLGRDEMSLEEILDYIRCMTLTPNVDQEVYYRLTDDNISEIRKYINDPMTATTIRESNDGSGSHEILTSEIIYYDMIALAIPFECQKWHLNRLITLIKVCNIKNSPQKKMSVSEIYSRNKALNEARKKQLNSKG